MTPVPASSPAAAGSPPRPARSPPSPTPRGKVCFGFVSRYKKGTSVPSGATVFRFQAGGPAVLQHRLRVHGPVRRPRPV
jgi:hypothetical protein